MAVRHFATNNLVEGHDNYIKFMKKRAEYFKDKELKNNDILFFKKGMVCEIFNITTARGNAGLNKYDRDITLWHCITIAYDIWSKYASKLIDTKHGSSVSYKLFVDIPENILIKIKLEFEQAIANAKCDYAKYTNRCADLTICRYLARFWTYLDIIKDTTTQRFFPNAETCFRAVKIFGYKTGDNPFIMNGKFLSTAKRNNGDESMVKEVTNYITNDTLLTNIIDDKRLTNPLWRVGIRTVGEFRSKSDKELLKIRTFGAVKLRKVREILNYLAPEESVIDIAEQAAKEVEEEKASPKAVIDEAILKEYEKKIDKATLIIDELRNTLSEKNKRITYLENDIAELEKRETKLNLAANPKNLDTFTLLNIILEKMKDSKMEYILLTIDGMTVDIHPAKSFPIRASYQIRSSEV